MGCNCKSVELILAVIVLIFVWWATSWSNWIITIAAVLLILHAMTCKKCASGVAMTPVAKAKPATAKKKK